MLKFCSVILTRLSRNLVINLRRSHSKIGVLGVPFDKGQVIEDFFNSSVTTDRIFYTQAYN
jgi:hypothetical protein